MAKYYVAQSKAFGDYYTGKTYRQGGETFPVLDELMYAKRFKSRERLQKTIDERSALWTWNEDWFVIEVEQ